MILSEDYSSSISLTSLTSPTYHIPPTSLSTHTKSTSPISPTSPTSPSAPTSTASATKSRSFYSLLACYTRGFKTTPIEWGQKYWSFKSDSLLLNWQQLWQAASWPSPQPRQRCQPDEKLFEKRFNTRER